eukprot:12908313-Prorocentrum_lima.AAC.1
MFACLLGATLFAVHAELRPQRRSFACSRCRRAASGCGPWLMPTRQAAGAWSDAVGAGGEMEAPLSPLSL